MQNPAKKTGAEMSSEGLSASLSSTIASVSSTLAPSTPASTYSTRVLAASSAVYEPQPGTSTGILQAGLNASQPQPGSSQPQPGTSSGILQAGLNVFQHQPGSSQPQPGTSSGILQAGHTGFQPQPGSSQPQPGTSRDFLQTALFLSALDQNSMTESSRSPLDEHRLSILQEDLYLSDSDEEAADYELDLNSPTSDHAINISYTVDHVNNIYSVSGVEESPSDSVDETTNVDDQPADDEDLASDKEDGAIYSEDSSSDDDEDLDESDSDNDLSDDDSDLSDDDGELSDDEADNSDEDEADSSSDSSEDELDTVNCVPSVKRRPLHRADVLLYKTSSSTSSCSSTTMVQEPGRGVKRKRGGDESEFTPKRIKLEERKRVKRKRASSEHAFDDKRRKLEPIPSASNGMTHTRKRRGTSHSDPYMYPPSILKRQKMSDKADRVKANPCPKTCPCIAGNRVSRVRLRKLRRKYPVIQPLHKKLLNNRVLGPGNMSQHQCCLKGCCFRWLSKAVPHYALLDDYRPSDLGVQDFNWGQWKQGKGHVMARFF